jgi:hypothetical protein
MRFLVSNSDTLRPARVQLPDALRDERRGRAKVSGEVGIVILVLIACCEQTVP